MIENRLSQLIRPFIRNNGLVLLNTSGLALGLAGVIFIAIWIGNEVSYDRFFKNSERIFRVESLMNFTGEPFVWTVAPAPAAESIKRDFPEVEESVRLKSGYQDVLKVGEELFVAKNLYYTDNSYFKVFSTQVIEGNLSAFLNGNEEVVVSKNIAESLFGKGNPIGKTILLNNTDQLTIAGVINNSPDNTHLKIDFLISFSVLQKGGKKFDNWGQFDYITYILLKKNSDPKQFNTKLSGYLQSKGEKTNSKLFINPLTRLHLYSEPQFEKISNNLTDKGPITGVILFAIVGVVIFLIACINFINLSTSFATRRAKEIGIRKVNGARRINLILQLFGESVVQGLMATMLALTIVIYMLPVFRKIIGFEISLASLFSLQRIGLYLLISLLTSFISGVYPALILSSYDPVKVIKPLPEDRTKGVALRKILIVSQFVMSIIFIFCIIVMKKQINFMQQRNIGFNKDRVMVIYPGTRSEKADIIAEQIEKLPGVNKVATGGNVPVNMGNFATLNKWDGNITGKALRFHLMQVDDRYLDFLDIKLIGGTEFNIGTFTNDVIVNETAVKEMEMIDPINKTLWNGDVGYRIIGVVADFNFHKLKEKVLPVFIYKSKVWWSKRIFVKFEPGNNSQTIDKITEMVREVVPGFPVKYIFLDEEIEKYYLDEIRLNVLLNAAAILSIVISCIGLFSLTAFTINRRKREIGIRKVYGATAGSILLMLLSEFGKLILIATVLALPAGDYLIKQWLNDYAFHISLEPVYFLITLLIIISIASGTLLFHTLRAANLNPANSIKNE